MRKCRKSYLISDIQLLVNLIFTPSLASYSLINKGLECRIRDGEVTENRSISLPFKMLIPLTDYKLNHFLYDDVCFL